MIRMARKAAPGIPYHVTQRGKQAAADIFNNDDYLKI